MEELYKDAEYCNKELLIARGVFTSKDTFTKEKAESLEKGLALMYLYCPDSMGEIVLSHLNELEIRSAYLK